MTEIRPPSAAGGPRPLISVIMPARDVEAYVEEAVASILNQTEGDFEFLILDDASTDNTPAVLASITDPRVRVFRSEEPLGVSAARNRLLDMAWGEFLACMDADDISLPDRFALQVAHMRANPDLWICNGYLAQVNRHGDDAGKSVFTYPLEHDTITSMLLFGCPLAHPFVMFRGRPWREHGIRYAPAMTSAVDYELWNRIFLQYPQARFGCVDAVVGRYRLHDRSLTATAGERQLVMEDKARLQTLRALGFASDDPSLAAHRLLYRPALPHDDADHIRIFEWAGRLLEANRKTSLFHREIFEYLLSQRLIELAEAHPSQAALSGRLLAVWKEQLGETAPAPPSSGRNKKRPAGRTSRPRISVIMPAHNAGRFAGQAVTSILDQTEGDFEFLILDDGSSDNTYGVLTANADPRVRLFRNAARRGGAACRNTLLEAAQGWFLAFMDADDVSEPDRLSRQLAFLRENPDVWLCSGHTLLINERGEAEGRRVLQAPLGHDRIRTMLLFACPLAHPFVMARGDKWRGHGIRYNEAMTAAADYELWQRIALTWPEARFGNVDAILGRYRRHSGSTTGSDGTRWKRMEKAARLQTFQALGFAPDDPDIAFHDSLYDITLPIPDGIFLAGLFGWAARLREANDKTGLFNRELFASMLASRLEEVVNFHPEHVPLGRRLLAPWKPLAGESP